MELTRRDVVAALAAAGVAVGGATVGSFGDDEGEKGEDGPLGDDAVATLVAAAEVLYPSAVSAVPTFVERYARGRAADRAEHAAGTADAVAYLDEYAEAWHDAPFAALDPGTRATAFDRMGADTTDPDPEGSDTERVRYYVVNELLFALYASPTGGELVGQENPRGHPGGIDSYQRGPEP